MGKVIAVCTSDRKGIQKTDVQSGFFETDWGIQGDSHAGKWHRQISLLSADKIAAFNEKGAGVVPGAFGENLVVEGFDFRSLPVGTLLRCGDVLLEMTQIGKDCHSHCEIYKKMGDCIMPREGVFARVLEPGTISVGDEMCIEERKTPRPWQAAVITVSDKAFEKTEEDTTGPAIVRRLTEAGYEVVEQLLLPREAAQLKRHLMRLADQRQLDLILTAGGTGFGPRDIAPEASLAVAERQVPGIAEAMRAESLKITRRAMFSRGVSVLRGKSLIINLPGSPKASMESLDAFLDVLPHGLQMLRG